MKQVFDFHYLFLQPVSCNPTVDGYFSNSRSVPRFGGQLSTVDTTVSLGQSLFSIAAIPAASRFVCDYAIFISILLPRSGASGILKLYSDYTS